MRRILSVCAILMGLVGFLACAAVAVVVWPVTEQVVEQGDILAEEADRVLSTVDENLVLWDKRLNRVDARLVEVAKVCRRFSGETNLTAADRKAVEAAHARLSTTLQTASSTAEGLDSGAKALRNVARMLKSLATVNGGLTPDAQARLETIESLAAALEKIGASLKSIREKLPGLDDPTKRQRVAKAMLKTVEAFDGSLRRLETKIEDADAVVVEIQSDVAIVRDRLDSFSRYGPPLITAISLWLALGQLCLAYVGCRGLRKRRPAPAAETG